LRIAKSAAASELYVAPPEVLPDPAACNFYHRLDLPGLGAVGGQWDLRGGYDAYFGGHDFLGERVLDVGTASGALAFEIERRGAAEVVAFDLDEGATYDCRLPVDAAALEAFRDGVRQVKNGFWLAHGLLRSHVKVAYGDATALPEELGRFDTIVLGNVLQHLQNPVGAVLQAIARTDHLIVVEADWTPQEVAAEDFAGMVMFEAANPFAWFQVRPGLLRRLLERWGFTEQRLGHHEQLLVSAVGFTDDGRVVHERPGTRVAHFTLSARRRADGR
jgi:SAM-dependent methyltransferase